MRLTRIGPKRFGALLVALLCVSPVWAQLRLLSEQELSATHGQALLNLTNTSYGGFDFTRIALDADINLSANFQKIRLGEYNYAPNNGLGADIDMPLLQFSRSDGTAAQRLVQITNPYLEFVYRNAGTTATREVVGMRFGFDGISGDVGLTLASLSGSMLINGGTAGVLDSRTAPADSSGVVGKRWDGSCVAPCLALSQVGGVTAGDASGPSRDFWISVLKTGVQFQAPASTTQVPDIAQAGFWLNWRDKLTALNTTGTPPPNLPLGR